MTDTPEKNESGLENTSEGIENKEGLSESTSDSPHEMNCSPMTEGNAETNNTIIALLTEIRETLQYQCAHDKVKDEAFERLYTDLDAYKRDKSFEENKSLYLDLILLYDRLEACKSNAECVDIRCILESIQDELTEILFRREIELIMEKPISFDPLLQRAVKTESVEEIIEDGAVIQVLREGFVYKGAVIRPQEVVVGRFIEHTHTLQEEKHTPKRTKEDE